MLKGKSDKNKDICILNTQKAPVIVNQIGASKDEKKVWIILYRHDFSSRHQL